VSRQLQGRRPWLPLTERTRTRGVILGLREDPFLQLQCASQLKKDAGHRSFKNPVSASKPCPDMPDAKLLREPSVPEKAPVAGTATPRRPGGVGRPSQAGGPGDIMQGQARGEEARQLYWSLVLRNVGARGPAGGRRAQGPWPDGASSPASWVGKHRCPGPPAWGLEAQMLVVLVEIGVSLSLWIRPGTKADRGPSLPSLGCCMSGWPRPFPTSVPWATLRGEGQPRTEQGPRWPWVV